MPENLRDLSLFQRSDHVDGCGSTVGTSGPAAGVQHPPQRLQADLAASGRRRRPARRVRCREVHHARQRLVSRLEEPILLF